MKQENFKKGLYIRTLGIISTLAIAAFSLTSYTAKTFDDIWQQLGISKEAGMTNIRESFMNGYLHYYGVKNVRNIMANDRAAIAKDLVSYSKQLLSSETFKKQYETERMAAKPQAPEKTKAKTKEELRKEKIAETEKALKETEASLKKMTPEVAKSMQEVLDVFNEQLKEYRKPNSEMIDLFYQGEVMNVESSLKNYQEDVKEWEKTYPADSRQFVKTRLQKFVALAKTVDFNAELKTEYGKRKFVNPAYEGKPSDWKQIYRAGKEVIDPAVQAAEQWIKELQ
jgi:F0F1-type ATP synthase membrane subunit b/b'